MRQEREENGMRRKGEGEDEKERRRGGEGEEKGRMIKLRIEIKEGEYGKEKFRGREYVERSNGEGTGIRWRKKKRE